VRRIWRVRSSRSLTSRHGEEKRVEETETGRPLRDADYSVTVWPVVIDCITASKDAMVLIISVVVIG